VVVRLEEGSMSSLFLAIVAVIFLLAVGLAGISGSEVKARGLAALAVAGLVLTVLGIAVLGAFFYAPRPDSSECCGQGGFRGGLRAWPS